MICRVGKVPDSLIFDPYNPWIKLYSKQIIEAESLSKELLDLKRNEGYTIPNFIFESSCPKVFYYNPKYLERSDYDSRPFYYTVHKDTITGFTLKFQFYFYGLGDHLTTANYPQIDKYLAKEAYTYEGVFQSVYGSIEYYIKGELVYSIEDTRFMGSIELDNKLGKAREDLINRGLKL